MPAIILPRCLRKRSLSRLWPTPRARALPRHPARATAAAVLCALLAAACADKSTPPAGSAPNIGNGKALAERSCSTCHGRDGIGVAPAIPHLAAQRERYLLASLLEYKQGKRVHGAQVQVVQDLSTADMHNVSAYYASLPAPKPAPTRAATSPSPYEIGRALAASCARCHGADGNSSLPGTPSIAGQQPYYLAAAVQDYHRGDRAHGAMTSELQSADRLRLESMVLFFSAQKPIRRDPPARGDAQAGERASLMCAGCHGTHGVSSDATTPSLAGQDAEYLARAIKSYRTTRRNWGMQRYVASLSDRDIDNVAAFYASQEPRAAAGLPVSADQLATKCDRCHDDKADETVPKLRGQDKDYLVMALRAYRDDRRESTTMHRLSFPYSNTIIDAIASWYADQPAR